MEKLVSPDQIPRWIPGDLTLDSSPLRWRGMTLKGYHYTEQAVDIPDMRDYMIVIYRGAPATMRRRAGGPWRYGTVRRGMISLLTRQERSTWHWDRPIDVRHIYLRHEILAGTAEQIFERDPRKIVVEDNVCRADPFFSHCARILEREMQCGSAGHDLFIETLRTQIAIHVLRNYAEIEIPARQCTAFSHRDQKKLIEYITDNLGSRPSLADLSNQVGLSPYYFSRKFKATFGVAAHKFITKKRVERAKQLIKSDTLPMKAIATDCGFSDQSHLSRVFAQHVGITPGNFRKESQAARSRASFNSDPPRQRGS